MSDEQLMTVLREIWSSPNPERKEEFFHSLSERRLITRRPYVISQREFLLRQFMYIPKWIWVLSGIVLLFIIGICYRTQGNYPFALSPLLAGLIIMQSRRSFRWKMAEMEYSARFSLRSVMLARLFLAGTVVTLGLLVVICLVRHWVSYSFIRVFLYMAVPYLAAALAGALYERRQRTDHGAGSLIICLFISGFFTVAPKALGWLYEETQTAVWAALFVLLDCGLTFSTRKWIREMEEPIWN